MEKDKMLTVMSALANCFTEWDDLLLQTHDLLEKESDIEIIRSKSNEFVNSVLCITESIISEKKNR